jgi:hypothetical protein
MPHHDGWGKGMHVPASHKKMKTAGKTAAADAAAGVSQVDSNSCASLHLLEVCQCWDGAPIPVVDRLPAHCFLKHTCRQHIACQQQQQQQHTHTQYQQLKHRAKVRSTAFLGLPTRTLRKLWHTSSMRIYNTKAAVDESQAIKFKINFKVT